MLKLYLLHEGFVMSVDENSSIPWVRHSAPSTFPHPNAPAAEGTPVRERIMSDPRSSGGRDYSPENVAAGYAAFELKRVLDKIQQARNAEELFRVAGGAFGSNAVSGRFCHAQRGAREEKQFLELQRLLVQAELHDHLTGHVAWPSGRMNGLDFHGPALWQVGHYLRHSRRDLLPGYDRLRKAAETRDMLLKELTALFTPTEDVLAPVKALLKPQTLEHWAHYSELSKRSEILSRSESGWFLGKVVLDVLPIIATESKAAVFAAKLSGVARQLLKLAHTLNARPNGEATDREAVKFSWRHGVVLNSDQLSRREYPKTNPLEPINS